jgi:3' terminal RNA ribose 2'-O-methyltransferase Hen1
VLLTITNTRAPATDIGYLLHKNPARVHERQLAFGKATIFYPEAGHERCTAALLLDIDPVGLVRRGHGAPALEQYVNDRPYVASSFLSVAIADAFGTAMAGRSSERPGLVDERLPLKAHLPAVPCRGGEGLLRRLFGPLGYAVLAQEHPLDPAFPEWGTSRYLTVTLEQDVRLRDLLTHLYVLLPVLDDEKHYWVSEPEVEKLLRRGEGWLSGHPERELIVERYLVRQRPLTRHALAQLVDGDPDPDAADEAHDREEDAVEAPISLNEERLGTVMAALRAAQARSVLDLGCGEGRLLARLLDDPTFERIVGLDVSHRSLDIAERRLRLDRLPERKRARIQLIHGSLIYRDRRLTGFDAAALVEVIEHLDADRLASLEAAVFGTAQPGVVIVTTPNVEYNVRFETLPAGRFRHRDHRFEWTREQLRGWAGAVAERRGYRVRFVPVGPEDPDVGPPTQMAVFER